MSKQFVLKLRKCLDTLYSTKYGYMTDVFIGGSFMMLSDAIAQRINHSSHSVAAKEFNWDKSRIVHLGYFGSFSAFYQHFFYKWLDRRLPGASSLTVVKKVCADELIIAPISVTLFSAYNGFLETRDMAGAVENWKRLFVTAYTADLAYWTVFQSVNFYLVPSRYRITYISVVTVVWNTFLCFLDLYKRDEAHQQEQPDSPSTPVSNFVPTPVPATMANDMF